MAMEETNFTTNIDQEGNVCISNEVVATIASIAAKSIDGVAEMYGSLTGGFAELLGKKNPAKGVKVAITDKDVKIDMAIVVEYGVKIPDVAWEVQDKTKNEVEAMTGLNVVEVNVSVEGVNTTKKVIETENAAELEISTEEAAGENEEA